MTRFDRFELRNRLGSGGVGVVHRAYDRVRNSDVAIKTLVRGGGREIYRFKREFRALADLAHPNLVSLYELYTVDDEWMFTMELVDGVPFHQWVRPPEPTRLAADEDPTISTEIPLAQAPLLGGDLDLARLRDALAQLADGLTALHGAGKLHRDIKPSNVLVEPSGRVVILDFGLVVDVDHRHVDRTHQRGVIGTPTYMSPEQAADQALTEASDWYSVGVMLFEALTGRRVFDGPTEGMLTRKRSEDPPSPRALAPATPEDLDRLCTELLARDPARRPDGRAVLAALGRTPSAATERILDQVARPPFVGRAAELAVLRASFAASRARATTCVVVGESGMGKTALVRAFLDEISVDGEVAILEGRCYERESVPYKALDGVIDDLTALLFRTAPEVLRQIVPADIGALTRVFPVFRRVPELSPTSLLVGDVDPIDLRRRGLDALRELVAHLAALRPLVIAIDDLHWGDTDSARALADLLAEPDAPRMLLVITRRSAGAAEDERLAMVRRAAGAAFRRIHVGALGDAEAELLWAQLRGGPVPADAIRDAGGNPMLLAEMARLGDEAPAVHTVDEAVRSRLTDIPEDARQLLRAVATAARPIPTELMVRAAGVHDSPDAIAVLRMERLVRVGGGEPATIEPVHDRIREAVIGTMSDEERRDTHRAIANVLAAAEPVDHELLVDHWLGAGDGARAAYHAELAAEAADARLALHRAAQLYGIALEHGELDDVRRGRLATRRAEALAAAGRLVEAADQFQAAAALVPVERDRRDLRRRSIEELIRSGNVQRGVDAARSLLRSVGISMPHGWRRTLFALLRERVRLRLRGLGYERRSADDVDPDALDRIDLLWSMASGCTFVEPMLGRVLSTRMLRLALDAGDARRIALALALELGFRATVGVSAIDETEALYAKASTLADELGDEQLRGFVDACGGVGAYVLGRFRVGRTRLVKAEALLHAYPRMRWQLEVCQISLLTTQWYLGELDDMIRLHRRFLREAVERSNVDVQRGLRGWRNNVVWLIQDDPAAARAQAALASAGKLAGGAYHLHHYYDLLAETRLDLYEGKLAEAFTRLEEQWPRFQRSLVARIQFVAIEAEHLRGTVALGAGAIELAARCVRGLERHRAPMARALAALLRGDVLAARGDLDGARVAFQAAIAANDECGMGIYRAVAELRLGVVEGGVAGRARADRALGWLRERGVVAPARLAAILSSGTPDAAVAVGRVMARTGEVAPATPR